MLAVIVKEPCTLVISLIDSCNRKKTEIYYMPINTSWRVTFIVLMQESTAVSMYGWFNVPANLNCNIVDAIIQWYYGMNLVDVQITDVRAEFTDESLQLTIDFEYAGIGGDLADTIANPEEHELLHCTYLNDHGIEITDTYR